MVAVNLVYISVAIFALGAPIGATEGTVDDILADTDQDGRRAQLWEDDDVLKCFQCVNCSTVTVEDIKDCEPDNDICQIIYKDGIVSRHCLDDTGEFEYKCKEGQCFCEPYKSGEEIPCNNNAMFDILCANDTAFKSQFSAVCPPDRPEP